MFSVMPGTMDVMPVGPAVKVARSPLCETVTPSWYTTSWVAGMVKVTDQLPIDTVVRFSTKTCTRKVYTETGCGTRQVGAGLLGVVKVSGSERGDWLPALSNAVTATV
jgi:hypothetical protein